MASCDWLIVASLSFNTGEKVERRRIVGLELVEEAEFPLQLEFIGAQCVAKPVSVGGDDHHFDGNEKMVTIMAIMVMVDTGDDEATVCPE